MPDRMYRHHPPATNPMEIVVALTAVLYGAAELLLQIAPVQPQASDWIGRIWSLQLLIGGTIYLYAIYHATKRAHNYLAAAEAALVAHVIISPSCLLYSLFMVATVGQDALTFGTLFAFGVGLGSLVLGASLAYDLHRIPSMVRQARKLGLKR